MMKSVYKTYKEKYFPVRGALVILLAAMALLLSSCYEMTVQVARMPSNTPVGEPLYITGNFNNWDPGDSRYMLQRTGDSSYEVKLPRGIGALEYKFTRGDWTTVEKDICGYEIQNRVLFYGRSEVVVDTIHSWNDLPPLDCPYITLVIDSLPESTPEESRLSVAGTFNNWDPESGEWQFRYDTSLGKPVLRLPRIGGDRTIDLKITRGGLERMESDELGREIPPREIVFGEKDTVFIAVEGWEDISTRKKGNRLTIIVNRVPASTPPEDPIYIAGSFNGWYPRSGEYRLEKNRQGQYFIHLPKKGSQVECKFTRGSWSTEEVDRWGFRMTNRVLGFDRDTVFLQVANWRDLSRPQGPPVRVIVESVPENTPENAELFIAGNFNNWAPGDLGYLMMRTDDGKYFVDLPRSEYTLEFKVTRGSWGTVECKANGDDIENRVYAYKNVEEIRIDIEGWKDQLH